MQDVKSRIKADRRSGFNLIEVSLAVFVMALGMLSLFALFPTGLGMADSARQDTQAGMFADYVFGAIRVKAAAGGNWTDDAPAFRNAAAFESPSIQTEGGNSHLVNHSPANPVLVRFPAHADGSRHQTFLRYTLSLEMDGPGNRVGAATLEVWPGRTGAASERFYTEIYPFQEVVP